MFFRPGVFFRTLSLMLHLAVSPKGNKNSKGIPPAPQNGESPEKREKQPQRISKRIPSHLKKGPTWMVVHGVTVNGSQDYRLQHFTRCLERSGISCISPTLNGLSACRWQPSDVDDLVRLVKQTSEYFGKPIGLIGFSWGGSYCLLTAARKELQGLISRVITFGAYHSSLSIIDTYRKALADIPQSEEEWENGLYLRLVLLKGYGDTSLLAAEGMEAVETMLKRYCTGIPPAEKKEFYRRYLSHIDCKQIMESTLDKDVLYALSPHRIMEDIPCPVTLVHDRNDGMVPPVHSLELFTALQSSPANKRGHRLVMTNLLSHVSPRTKRNIIYRWVDVMRLTMAMSGLFTKSKKNKMTVD